MLSSIRNFLQKTFVPQQAPNHTPLTQTERQTRMEMEFAIIRVAGII